MDQNTRNNSIQIYRYKKEIQLSYDVIEEKINGETEHKYSLKIKKGEKTKRYSTFEFKKITSIKENEDVLWYSVDVQRETESEVLSLHHNVCFSKKGFLIITGMTNRDTLLKYLVYLLHPQKYVFESKYLSKKEIQEFTNKLLKKNVNKIYQPRFRFSERYRKREFNDFIVGEEKCATDDKEYPKMMKKCSYFEPVFKLNKINDDDIITKFKVNHAGRLYSSRALNFKQWISLIKNYLSWCM